MSITTFNAAIAASKGRDLSAAIAAAGYTRGFAQRGRVVLTGEDVIVVEYDADRMAYAAIAAFPTADEAVAFCKADRANDAFWRRRIAAYNATASEQTSWDRGN